MGNVDLTILREHTVLCKVYTSAYGMTRVDRLAAARAEQDGVALGSNAKVVVATNPQLAITHANLVAAQQEARNTLRKLSMPYLDEDGWRILPVSSLTKFVSGYANAKNKFNMVRNHLIAEYLPTMVTQGNHDVVTEVVADSPEQARVRAIADAYTLDWRVHDYPANRFSGLSEKAAGGLKERHDKELARVVAGIRDKALDRLAEPAEHMLRRLKSHAIAVAANERTSLRSSMLINLGEAADVARSFNVYGDTQVEALCEEAKHLAGLDIDVLRSDASAAASASDRARNLYERIGAAASNHLLTLAG